MTQGSRVRIPPPLCKKAPQLRGYYVGRSPRRARSSHQFRTNASSAARFDRWAAPPKGSMQRLLSGRSRFDSWRGTEGKALLSRRFGLRMRGPRDIRSPPLPRLAVHCCPNATDQRPRKSSSRGPKSPRVQVKTVTPGAWTDRGARHLQGRRWYVATGWSRVHGDRAAGRRRGRRRRARAGQHRFH
jgi:hypothetical protein